MGWGLLSNRSLYCSPESASFPFVLLRSILFVLFGAVLILYILTRTAVFMLSKYLFIYYITPSLNLISFAALVFIISFFSSHPRHPFGCVPTAGERMLFLREDGGTLIQLIEGFWRIMRPKSNFASSIHYPAYLQVCASNSRAFDCACRMDSCSRTELQVFFWSLAASLFPTLESNNSLLFPNLWLN